MFNWLICLTLVFCSYKNIELDDILSITYEYVDSDYYQEPHSAYPHTFGENTPISFLYELTIPLETSNYFYLLDDGSVYVVEDILFSWSDLIQEERVPIFRLDSLVMEELLQAQKSVNLLKPVQIDNRNSHLEEEIPFQLIQMIRGDTIVTLEKQGKYCTTSTDENVQYIISVLNGIYEFIFEENHIFPSDETNEVPMISYNTEDGVHIF